RFEKRGQILPRDRLTRLLDPGAPFLEIGNMAGYLQDTDDPESTVPGGAQLAGIGFVGGVRAVIVVNDSGIGAGALTAAGGQKILRCQRIALENKLPFIHLVESAGADLLKYRVDGFVNGGAIFCNLARLSAAGIPVVTILHGSSTAGGAYMPGLSDMVIAVRGRGKAFLAGPPLLKAATGEIATDEELGGAEMHATISGLAEHLAEDDTHAIAITRDVLRRLGWAEKTPPPPTRTFREPEYDPDELAGIVPLDYRKPYDVKEVIARVVDGSDLLEFKGLYGPHTVCVQGHVFGHACGFIGNNGPIDPDGATKAAQFIQHCCQTGTPIVYLQNTTGYMVGTQTERGGMIKHGSKMIQAVSNASVPQFTFMIGASFGAGNYGMCGRAYDPRFCVTWPNARTGVMGAEQAATTMRIVMEASAKRRGKEVDEDMLGVMEKQITELFAPQEDAFVCSGHLLDDGMIDPRETRRVLGFLLGTVHEAELRDVRPNSFGVARM
ncbi:MAG: acyl-CoA carboxylase subunit beta, partial [Alphaproteobacteria bacterium]